MKNKIKIANNTIVGVVVISMIAIIIYAFITMLFDHKALVTPWLWLDVFIIPIMGLAALAGVISVVASNEKSPIKLLILSIIATLYKMAYPFIQKYSGQEGVNSTVILGQSFSLITIFIQVYFWIRWNKQSETGKFSSQVFKGKRTIIAIIIILIAFIVQITISVLINKANALYVIMDILGGMLYTIASTLMAFGNIFCFLFFFLSDMNWLYWTITDITTSDNGLMMVMAITTTIEILAYILLVFTGFAQWLKDDFEIIDRKIIRKERENKHHLC